MGAKRKAVNSARWRNNQVGSKLLNKPINQPFTVPGTLMEEISRHSRGRSYTGELKPSPQSWRAGRNFPGKDTQAEGEWQMPQAVRVMRAAWARGGNGVRLQDHREATAIVQARNKDMNENSDSENGRGKRNRFMIDLGARNSTRIKKSHSGLLLQVFQVVTSKGVLLTT